MFDINSIARVRWVNSFRVDGIPVHTHSARCHLCLQDNPEHYLSYDGVMDSGWIQQGMMLYVCAGCLVKIPLAVLCLLEGNGEE